MTTTESQYAERPPPIARHWSIALVVMMGMVACGPDYRPGLPPGSPFAEAGREPTLAHGLAVGDVTDRSAVVWIRSTADAEIRISWTPEPPAGAPQSTLVRTLSEQDYTAKVPLDALAPATRYRYTAEVVSNLRPSVTPPLEGHFSTAPTSIAPSEEVLVWSADLGGQQRCRREPDGYAIFDVMRASRPGFALLLGDLIYADDRCPAPPNATGSEFTATTLGAYRAKHRYQREDAALQRFLSAVPVSVMWDDHEVRNNFAGPVEPLMPAGRQALLDYWPIATPPNEPGRLYRTIRRGHDLQIFLLDTRQYRSPNAERDSPAKSMLGAAQRTWLLEELATSTATWKIVTSSIPLANPKGGTLQNPGNDSWAAANDGTGFQQELRIIVDRMLQQNIHNVVWLTGDVHYAQVAAYDPDGDGVPDFHEAIAGPLSAAPGIPLPPDTALHPKTLYAEGGFANFGRITVTPASLRIEIVDEQNRVRFAHSLDARPPSSR